MPVERGIEPRLTSILVPVWNQLPLLRLALESIGRHTRQPHEIVIVDNGSRADVREDLAGRDVRLIVNPGNRGFAAAVNQLVDASRGGTLVLLNSDVQVTPGWLEELHEALALPGAGLAGPLTNNCSGAQCVPVDYARSGGPDGVARTLAATRFGAVREVERLVGFCLAFTRETADAVGEWDERFGIGNFEDDDYCLRTRLLGLKCLVVESCFVHHEGSATFRAEGVDYMALIERNRALFQQKWRNPELALLPSLLRRLETAQRAA
ncbi:MAG: glycosyltransferase family 2 protein [Candidatus Eisenbacteria bacterium]|nr:glycosyltransferase family 2 protein [Candidatus Eisenbacteria bacterium]